MTLVRARPLAAGHLTPRKALFHYFCERFSHYIRSGYLLRSLGSLTDNPFPTPSGLDTTLLTIAGESCSRNTIDLQNIFN